MKSLILITFIIGLLFFTVGYTKNLNCKKCSKGKSNKSNKNNSKPPPVKLDKLYSNIFKDPSVWLSYPFNTRGPD